MRGWTNGVDVVGSHRCDGAELIDSRCLGMCFSFRANLLKTNLFHGDAKPDNTSRGWALSFHTCEMQSTTQAVC